MRGYRCLQAQNKLGLIRILKIQLSETQFDRIDRLASATIFGPERGRAELATRQYLLSRLVNSLEFNKRLLSAMGEQGAPFADALPMEWRRTIAQAGFEVAWRRSALRWWWHVAMMWAYGLLTVLRLFFRGVWKWARKTQWTTERHAYFDGLTRANLPDPGRHDRSDNILSWYAAWSGRAEDLETLAHGVAGEEDRRVGRYRIAYVYGVIPPLDTAKSLLRYARWAVTASLRATADMFRGRWWHALMLAESARAAVVRLQDTRRLARDYLFQADWIYRPLWTYEAERKGSRIVFYFYSTNSEGFKRADGYRELDFDWRSLTWSRYLVWDDAQAAFLRKGTGPSPIIEVVGPIPFQSSATELPQVEKAAIAMFDVQPVRSSMYQSLGLDFDYYTPEHCIQFVTDIAKAAGELNYSVLWKRKREIGKLAHPRYRAFARSFSASEAILPVDPQTAAYSVIEAADLVISMPFTSTALIARSLNKPTCYYDATGQLYADDTGAHGVTIVRGPDELRNWILQNGSAGSS